MKRPFPGKVDFLMASGMAFALFSLILFALVRFEPAQHRMERFENQIQTDFRKAVAEATFISGNLAKDFMQRSTYIAVAIRVRGHLGNFFTALFFVCYDYTSWRRYGRRICRRGCRRLKRNRG